MAKICPLFSGSTGNCTYIKDGESGILIDAGASYKRICEAAELAGVKIQNIRAVCITHEHIDHVAGLKVLLKKTGAPLFASKTTLEALITADKVPENADLRELSDECVPVGDMGIMRFDTSHDCAGSSGYNVFLGDGRKVSVCTDLGIVTDTVREHLIGSTAMLFESNHDVEMLRTGPYPPQLKLRILSEKGHLSNVACSSELAAFLKSGTTRFILGHLSQNNNLPMLAKTAAKTALTVVGANENEDYILSVAKPLGNTGTAI